MVKCPHCGSEQTVKAGVRKNKYVTRQQYKCNDCNRRFVERDGFEGKTYPGEVIALVLHLFVEGLSLSKIREVVYQHHGYGPIADSTILDWVKEYSKLIRKFERKRMPKPKVRGRVHLDEPHLKVGKKESTP
jgi:transposase-like protein